jgi:hypothetical protein
MASQMKLPRHVIISVHPWLIPWTEPESPVPESHRWRLTIAESMRMRGWVGRPLLVHARGDGTFQAWQGMHRLRAASDAGIDEIPALVLSLEELRSIGFNDDDITGAPWALRHRLAALPDPAPHQLVMLEMTEEPKRGW